MMPSNCLQSLANNQYGEAEIKEKVGNLNLMDLQAISTHFRCKHVSYNLHTVDVVFVTKVENEKLK